MRKRRTSWAVAVSGIACLGVLLVAGCGDEDGGTTTIFVGPSLPPPGVPAIAEGAAIAGPNQTVARGATVTLDGSASHGQGTAGDPEGTAPSSYAWALTSGPAVTFTPDIASPVFTAPSVDGPLVFTLTVDGQYTDTVTVNVQKLVVELGEEIWVGGYGKSRDITAAVSPAGTYDFAWTQSSGQPVPLEWNPVDPAANPLQVTTPLLTDLTELPGEFGILPVSSLMIGRANSSYLTLKVTVVLTTPVTATASAISAYDSANDETTITTAGLTADAHVGEAVIFATSSEAYSIVANTATAITVTGDASAEVATDNLDITPMASDTVRIQIVGPTTGGDVIPVGVPCFLNGGAGTTYSWSGTAPLLGGNGVAGELTTDTAQRVQMFVPADPGNYTFVCQVDGGATVEAVTVRAAEYVGVGTVTGRDADEGQCRACHAGQFISIGDQVTEWEEGDHSTIFENMIASRYSSYDFYKDVSCFHCHTTGYNERDTTSNDGFDDRAAASGVKMTSFTGATAYADFELQFPEVAELANIQCEACHGPGSLHGGDTAGTYSIPNTGQCAQCHGDHGHEVREFYNSVHTGIDISHGTRASCARCHAGQGMSYYLRTGVSGPALLADEVGEKTCSTCHDSHTLELRVDGVVQLPNGVSFDFGHSAICAMCHNGRRDTSVGAALSPTMPHHGSQQAAMLAGTGAMEFTGWTYVNGPHTAGAATGPAAHCSDCHMASKEAYKQIYHGSLTGMPFETIGGHTWHMTTAESIDYAANGTHGTATTIAGTREIYVAPGSASFVGLVEVGDEITWDGVDAYTGVVQAVLSSRSLLIDDPVPATPTMFTGGNAGTWSITRPAHALVEGCQACHPGGWPMTETLAITASDDWDGDSSTETVQLEIDGLLTLLLAEIEGDLSTKVGRSVTLVDYRKGRYNDGYYDYDYPSYNKSNKDRTVQVRDDVNGNGVYTAGTDTTVITLTTGGLTVDAHIGQVLVFDDSGEQYDIVDNDAGTITVDGDASGELTDDAVSIATETPSAWDSEWEAIYKATYNYFFVWQDHSGGIHNTGYAVNLLQSSIDELGTLPAAAAPYVAP